MKRLSLLPFLLLCACTEPIVMDPLEEMPVVVRCVLTRDLIEDGYHPGELEPNDYVPPMQFLDLYPGSVSVMGLMNDKEKRVRLVIDEDVLKEEMFGCHPCANTSSIRFATKDLVEKILPALGRTYDIVHLVGVE